MVLLRGVETEQWGVGWDEELCFNETYLNLRLGTQVEVRDLEVWSQGVFKATILGKIIQCMSVDRFRA